MIGSLGGHFMQGLTTFLGLGWSRQYDNMSMVI